jgi:DeoR family transcriptional regulator, suf operon transcriptional repressor
MLRQQLLDSSRGRIVTLLRGGGLTADDIASKLKLTRSAIQAHVTRMERDGVVRRAGQRPGTTRPSHIFELTPDVEQLLSSAYIPLLTHLVRIFADALPAERLDALLRQAGKGLADELSRGRKPSGNLRSRLAMASEMMNEQLGAVTHVEGNGRIVIRGVACPLSALTGKHPAVCLVMESFVADIVGAQVRECCDRTGQPRCCFEVQSRGQAHRGVTGDRGAPARANRTGTRSRSRAALPGARAGR